MGYRSGSLYYLFGFSAFGGDDSEAGARFCAYPAPELVILAF